MRYHWFSYTFRCLYVCWSPSTTVKIQRRISLPWSSCLHLLKHSAEHGDLIGCLLACSPPSGSRPSPHILPIICARAIFATNVQRGALEEQRGVLGVGISTTLPPKRQTEKRPPPPGLWGAVPSLPCCKMHFASLNQQENEDNHSRHE